MSAIIYLLQVSACIALFYAFYYFLLNRLTFFTINRYYLLFTLLISFVIPLLTIHLHQQDNYPRVMQQVVYVNTLQNSPVYTPIVPVHKAIAAPAFSWPELLKMVYLLAVITLFVHLLLTLINFFAKLRSGKKDRIGRVNVLHSSKSLTNGSFLNYIFLNDDELSPDELQQVIAHEMLHVKLLHSIDRIVAKIVQIILWFNPFIYLYVRSIEENHEFEVDRQIARSTDKNNYAELLLHLSIARGGMLYHSFSKVPLKKRIVMLFNKPSANVKRVIYVLIVPVVVVSCLAFARLKKDDKKPVEPKPFSVVKGLDKLGKNPLVIIDGETYPADILYKISSLCIAYTKISPPDVAEKKYGAKAKDGEVTIYTHNYRVITMTPIERENLVKEAAVPATQFYTRLTLKRDNGKLYDEIIINFKYSREISRNEHGAKVAFFIDGKRYNEDYIKNLSPAVIATLSGEAGVDNPKTKPKKWPNTQDCESVIYFNTAVMAKNKPIVNAVAQQPVKNKPTVNAVTLQSAPNVITDHVVFPPSYTANPFVTFNRTPINYMQKGSVALAYLRNNNIAECDKTLASITDNYELLYALNEVAWQSAVDGENLAYIEKLSKQSVDIVKSLSEHPVAGPYGTIEETKAKLRDNTFMVVDTYAFILYKEGKYAEALKVQQPLFDMIIKRRGSPVVEHYAEILAANNNYIKAKEVAEICFRDGYVSPELSAALKESYIKINGSDKGYDEYLRGLEANSDNTMLQRFAKDIQTLQQRTTGRTSYMTDTVEFDAKAYNAKTAELLSGFLPRLPGFTVDEYNNAFFRGQKIKTITVNRKEFAHNNATITVTALRAIAIDKVQMINPDNNSSDRVMSMNIQLKPTYSISTAGF